MYLNCKLTVTIDGVLLKTVSAVSINNDSKDIGSDCDIVVPINCRLEYADGTHDFLNQIANNPFNTGDEVVIQAQYDGYPLLTVFHGYVVDFIEGMPIKIKCQDNIFLLDQTSISVAYQSVTLQQLIANVIQGTGIRLIQPILQLNLVNISFKDMSPAAILEWLKRELGLVITLSGTDLYVNIASNTLNVVKFSTDINVLRSDLQKPNAVFLKLKLKAWFIRENGTKDSLEVGDPNGQLREVYFYKVPYNLSLYTQMANDALAKYKQFRYQGSIDALLYPDVNLYDKVNYNDVRYPDKNGNYVCVGIHTELGAEGFHRKLRLSYLSDN